MEKNIRKTLLDEFNEQERMSTRAYAKLAAAASDDVSYCGSLSSENFEVLKLLFSERNLYADEALYDFLANIWTLPEAFSERQLEILIDTIIEAPFDDISENNAYVVADVIMKMSSVDRQSILITNLKNKENSDAIVRFILASRGPKLGGI